MQFLNRETLILEVGGRASPLSKIQIEEVREALQFFHPYVEFHTHTEPTIGDKDQATSLRTLDRTNFFTKEIDEWVLSKKGRIGIHSAKDLPIPLAPGLCLFCLTRGLDSSDSLVLRPNETVESLPPGACIATSSEKREENVKQLRKDLTFCDLRGAIGQRLDKLKTGEADGVVVAEAALIRLGLRHLNRARLPGKTTDGQGQLAVVGRVDDPEIQTLFACLDVRSKND